MLSLSSSSFGSKSDSPSDAASLTSITSLARTPPYTPSPRPVDLSGKDIASEHHCVLTLQLPRKAGYIASLLTSDSQGAYLYGALSSSSTIYVWSIDVLNKGHSLSGGSIPGKVTRLELGSNSARVGRGGLKAVAVVGEHRLVTAHDHDSKLRIWEKCTSQGNSGNIVHVPETATSQVPGLSYHSRFKLLCTMPTIKDYLRTFIVDRKYVQARRHHSRLWIEHVDTISALAVSADGGYLYSASWDRSIKVWKLPSFKCVESMQNAHDDAINCMILCDDDRYLYSGSADSKIKVWSRLHTKNMCAHAGQNQTVQRNGRMSLLGKQAAPFHLLISTLEGHKSAVNALALSPRKNVLYSGAGDKAILVWEIRQHSAAHMVLTGKLRGHRKAILCLATIACSVRNGNEVLEQHIICSGSADKTVRIWRRIDAEISSDIKDNAAMHRKYQCLAVLAGHSAPVKSLCLYSIQSSSYIYIYSASLDKTVKVWQMLYPTSLGIL
ncbi:hypothetical protein KP509_39G055900 [Ceratopteris richardii]|uniref:Uncharacterized protein n=1 Tax=Ceratopteris richardii TaxID=49495 RepID=A0A8T2Q1I2_CERRI|nr:hypothetical protein KP509_39G055900 [Ceratopteris richardii]